MEGASGAGLLRAEWSVITFGDGELYATANYAPSQWGRTMAEHEQLARIHSKWRNLLLL